MRLDRVLLALSLVGIVRGGVRQRPLSLSSDLALQLEREESILNHGSEVSGEKAWHVDNPTVFHGAYHPLYEIEGFISSLASSYPQLVTKEEIGTSAEGRGILALRIANDTRPEDGDERETKQKGVLVVSGAQHAREWIAIASALYLADALVSSSAHPSIHHLSDTADDVHTQATKLTGLLDKYDIHIIPVPNPDGYVYTWEEDRMWYKNRQDVSRDSEDEDGEEEDDCVGLDMNRNWDFAWTPDALHGLATSPFTPRLEPSKKKTKKGKKKKQHPPSSPSDRHPGPATDRCSHWYPGTRPFEAPETRAIASYIRHLSEQDKKVEVFLDLRSYGQMLSFPYSYSCDDLPADAENLYEAALGAAFDVRKLQGTIYTTGSLCANLYPAPGNIIDWMYGVAGIKFVYSLHLGDTGTYGYTLPSAWIRPVGSETATIVASIGEFAAHLRK